MNRRVVVMGVSLTVFEAVAGFVAAVAVAASVWLICVAIAVMVPA